jgi:hypothetical protein
MEYDWKYGLKILIGDYIMKRDLGLLLVEAICMVKSRLALIRESFSASD